MDDFNDIIDDTGFDGSPKKKKSLLSMFSMGRQKKDGPNFKEETSKLKELSSHFYLNDQKAEVAPMPTDFNNPIIEAAVLGGRQSLEVGLKLQQV